MKCFCEISVFFIDGLGGLDLTNFIATAFTTLGWDGIVRMLGGMISALTSISPYDSGYKSRRSGELRLGSINPTPSLSELVFTTNPNNTHHEQLCRFVV